MSRICIVLIYGPQNIIPAFSAVKYYSQLKKEKIKSVQTVVFTPGLDEEYINEFKPIINNFVKSEGYLPPIFIKKEDVQILFHPPKIMTDFLIRKFIKKYVGLKNVDEIYFGHNIVGPFTDFCIQAFNKSELIIYGDGYGYINNEVKANFFEESINFEKNGVERIFNRFSNLIKKNSKQKVSIAAILPSNLSENELMTTKLHIVSKDIVLSIISKFNDNFNDIEKYFHSINFQKNPYEASPQA